MKQSVVFTMGLPAAGKTTWVNANLAETHEIIDPDLFKETHPDYDPNNPAELHVWSQEEVERRWNSCLAIGEGLWVVDGTGTNAEKMVRRINQAKAAGYSVSLVYVTCSLKTSLERNQARERKVPEHIVRSKALDISTSFEIVSAYVDDILVVDNN